MCLKGNGLRPRGSGRLYRESIRDLRIRILETRMCDLRQTEQDQDNIGLYGTTKALTEEWIGG